MNVMNAEYVYITGNQQEGYNLSFMSPTLNSQYKAWALHHESLLAIIQQASWQRFDYFLSDTSDEAESAIIE